MTRDDRREERVLLAAVGAALLGSQGSPVWSRTAEHLLLSSVEVNWRYRKAACELAPLFLREDDDR
jgi:hypothetical protein